VSHNTFDKHKLLFHYVVNLRALPARQRDAQAVTT